MKNIKVFSKVRNKMYDDDLFNDTVKLSDKFDDEIDVGENKLATKSMQIQQLISHFEYRLLGYMWKSNGEKYYFTGNPLMGDESIQKTMLLLHPFSREVLLISNKQDFMWQKQLLRTRLEMAALLTKAVDVHINDSKEIWRSFSNLLFNIGDIIVNKNSQEFLKGFFKFEQPNNNNDKDVWGETPKQKEKGGTL